MTQSFRNVVTIVLFGALLNLNAVAQAEAPRWDNVASYLGQDGNRYFAQIDDDSRITTDEGARFWIRLVKAEADADEDNPFLKYGPAESGPALYEMRCKTEQLRLLQGQIIFGYAGPGKPLDRPANWEYVVPGSLGQIVYSRICQSTDA